MAPSKKSQKNVTDLENRTCHLSGCKVVVGSQRTMCPVHRVEHAKHQAALRQKRKDDLECVRCGAKIDNNYFSNCAKCRFKKSQYQRKMREERKSSSGTGGGNRETEAAHRQQQSFIELVCSPPDSTEHDVEAAKILMQMSKPRYNLRSLAK
ncbi:hypothetical protein F5B22DRAFT_597116 [Xylaria bambusicola]|uniref:uncharacterized protein n=1 Tax=Xylaria bambusicola TaxID=326684 RepID=UPI0020083E50|nr:uncharacterized protein F5B22DRAFT_597116 [Xylaria bambusicola]KAI0520989.1 hypothetical protein F5B22DRAFT_597116 [Xylaria bambusicola]